MFARAATLPRVKLRELGEFGLIDRIARAARAPARLAGSVALGIGDDAALLPDPRRRAGGREQRRLLRGRALPPAQREPAHGRAARAGGEPLGSGGDGRAPARLSARARGAAGHARCERSMRWWRACSTSRRGTPARSSGGNLSRARELSLTLTVIGAVARGRALRRGVARAGDRIFVTGTPGRGGARAPAGRARARPRALRTGSPAARRAGARRARAGGSPASTSRTGSTPIWRTCSGGAGWRPRSTPRGSPSRRAFGRPARGPGSTPRRSRAAAARTMNFSSHSLPGPLPRRALAPARGAGERDRPGRAAGGGPALPGRPRGWRHF